MPLITEVSFLSGGTPRMNESRFWGGDIPWVSSGEMTESRISYTQRRVTEDGARNGTRMVPANTVLVVVRGMSLAKEFRISISEREVTFNQDIKALQPSEKIDPWFLFYYLKSQKHAIRDSATDASHGTKKLETRVLEQWPFPLLDISTQRSIASILSAYDDLIENNRRRIQLLEQAARLLYKEWFVHLRFPGHEHTQIIDGVPEGWEKKKIAEVCETIGGGTPSTKVAEYWDGDITWAVPSDITNNNSLILLKSERKITEKGLRESSAKLVPAETILMTSRASVGFFALMDHEVCTNQGFINIVPHDDQSRMYLLFNLLSRVNEIHSNAKGTTYPEISKGRFREMDIIIPGKTITNQFEEIVYDIIRQVRFLMRSNMNLTKARDLLLPKLMNGEVAV
ncbi:MAG: restriction endonuclease subunit S [Desulfobulbus sp.]|nr:restriction endonuclease subunit S [Desulfobulbus sp.]